MWIVVNVLSTIYIFSSPAGRSESRKTVPEVLNTAQGRRPRLALKTGGTVFPKTDRPRLVNNIFFSLKLNEIRSKRARMI